MKKEKELFSNYLISNDFTVNGFSFGAQKAFEYCLNSEKRVDLLQLFSPAFFNDKDEKYKRLQLMFFKKDSKQYSDNFLKNCGFSKQSAKKYFSLGTYEQLDQLLNYYWCEEKFKKLLDKNIKLEIYLGAKDKIINPDKALEFFKNFGEVYFIKDKGHIL